jgi:Ca2+-binding RTX toxin-like protein
MLIHGTRYSDQLWGTVLGDRIFARQGDDAVHGSSGDDFLSGDAGVDYLYGDNGNDWLQGGRDGDVLFDQGEGADTLLGGRGDDFLLGDAVDYQRDALHGGPGADNVHGGTGFDLLIGGDGDDCLIGMGGEYYGDAAPGARQLPGGNDRLVTHLGSDYGTLRVMTSGGGADTFEITTNLEGVATPVVITDFHNGEDRFFFYGDGPGLTTQLDIDQNGRLDANDGIAYNPGNNSLIMTVGDGDSVTFLNADHVDFLF